MRTIHALSLITMLAFVGCSSSGTGGLSAGGSSSSSGGTDVAQNPPTTGYAAIEAWLASGFYKNWHCEAAAHDQRPPSPHSRNRVCNNDVLYAHTGTGEYPVDSASVKEIVGDDGTIVGYAVNRHISAGAEGANWYWYERVPLAAQVPHDENGVVVDGPGTSGIALEGCTGCHSAAGSDADHSGHDMVYTHVQ